MIAISMIGICSANDTRCHSQRIADLLLRDGLASLLRPIWCGPFGRLRLFADGSRYAEVIDLGGHCGILRRWHHILLKYSVRLQGRLASRLIEVVPLLRVVKSRPQQFALLGSVATCRSFESRWLDSMNLLRQFSCDNFQVFELGTFAYQSLTSCRISTVCGNHFLIQRLPGCHSIKRAGGGICAPGPIPLTVGYSRRSPDALLRLFARTSVRISTTRDQGAKSHCEG